MLFSEPKIPQCAVAAVLGLPRPVSVLFSEPKIPQAGGGCCRSRRKKFQCSSASRKFLNPNCRDAAAGAVSFSALQRAENSSTWSAPRSSFRRRWFQCSSASRKFLNGTDAIRAAAAIAFQCSSASRKFLNVFVVAQVARVGRFSALQRAENSSTERARRRNPRSAPFQCSSASRKFLKRS